MEDSKIEIEDLLAKAKAMTSGWSIIVAADDIISLCKEVKELRRQAEADAETIRLADWLAYDTRNWRGDWPANYGPGKALAAYEANLAARERNKSK